jgi:hypothetical protein
VEIAEFEKDERKAKVMRGRDVGYIVCKSDSKKFSGMRTSQYSTREKAIKAAKNFIKMPVLWTKGRTEHFPYVAEKRISNEHQIREATGYE